MKPSVKIKKLTESASVPKYATEGSMCFDFVATTLNGGQDEVVLKHGSPVVCGTGLSMEIPEGYGLKVHSRSGHGFNSSIRLANCTGLIDADYRGEIMIKLVCDNSDFKGLTLKPGDKVAQGEIVEVVQFEFEVVEELSSTERGTGGFGSTDKK